MTYPQPYPHPLPSTPPSNGLGTAGFVTGLIGLVFSVIPIVGVIAWPMVIIGLVLSSVGFAKGRTHHLPLGLSIAGISCSTVGLGICIVWVVAFTASSA